MSGIPSPETLETFAVASAALILLPGPNLIYIVARGIAQGRRAAYASALGVEVGTLVHITAAALGVSVILARSATAFTTVKLLGAAYLIYLGVKAFRGEDEIGVGDEEPAAASHTRLFGRGIVVNVLNPKVAIFFLAFFPQFVDPGRARPWSRRWAWGSCSSRSPWRSILYTPRSPAGWESGYVPAPASSVTKDAFRGWSTSDWERRSAARAPTGPGEMDAVILGRSAAASPLHFMALSWRSLRVTSRPVT